MSGDQSGCACLIRSDRPAMCGDDIDVPLSKSQFRPLWFGGATAARTSTPGAEMSGFSWSPVARLGPRDEKPAICGALGSNVAVPSVNDAVGFAVPEAYALIASPAVLLTWTAGATWMSPTSPAPATTLAMIVPTPPASLTASGLSTRAFGVGTDAPPRSQTTILPVTFAGSSTAVPPFADFEKHWRALSGSAPATPAAEAKTSGAEAAPFVTETPLYVAPLPSVTV